MFIQLFLIILNALLQACIPSHQLSILPCQIKDLSSPLIQAQLQPLILNNNPLINTLQTSHIRLNLSKNTLLIYIKLTRDNRFPNISKFLYLKLEKLNLLLILRDFYLHFYHLKAELFAVVEACSEVAVLLLEL